jgi:hypothetical protein
MVANVVFASRVPREKRHALEQLLFFNGCQARFTRDIVDVIDKYGPPEIYDDGAVLLYPQSGECISGRAGIQAARMAQPNRKRFSVRRMLGRGGLWISELVLRYDGR